jgi:hypothetical protein
MKVIAITVSLLSLLFTYMASAQGDFDSKVCRMYNYTPDLKVEGVPGLYGFMGQVFRAADGKLYGQEPGKNPAPYGLNFGGLQKALNNGTDITLAKNSDGSWLMELSNHSRGLFSSHKTARLLIRGAICDEILSPEKRQIFLDWAFTPSL